MPKVCPVIHVEDSIQLERNIEVALEAGVDGVFLINHAVCATDLAFLFRDVRPRYPDLWIGLNYLGLPARGAASISQGANGLWMDGVPAMPLGLPIPIFGGVAFKYQYSRLTIEEEVQKALPCVDVIVTSGNATGVPASVKKVVDLKALIPDTPLGLASGLTVANVRSYLPWVEWLLVATGVSNDFTNLCPSKLKDFIAAVRAP